MIDEINSSSTRQSHLPSRRERTELRYGLRLNGEVVSIRSHHSEQLLSSRIDPSRSSSAFKPTSAMHQATRERRLTCDQRNTVVLRE